MTAFSGILILCPQYERGKGQPLFYLGCLTKFPFNGHQQHVGERHGIEEAALERWEHIHLLPVFTQNTISAHMQVQSLGNTVAPTARTRLNRLQSLRRRSFLFCDSHSVEMGTWMKSYSCKQYIFNKCNYSKKTEPAN